MSESRHHLSCAHLLGMRLGGTPLAATSCSSRRPRRAGAGRQRARHRDYADISSRLGAVFARVYARPAVAPPGGDPSGGRAASTRDVRHRPDPPGPRPCPAASRTSVGHRARARHGAGRRHRYARSGPRPLPAVHVGAPLRWQTFSERGEGGSASVACFPDCLRRSCRPLLEATRPGIAASPSTRPRGGCSTRATRSSTRARSKGPPAAARRSCGSSSTS